MHRPDREQNLKLDTPEPPRGMPLESNRTLHTWMKYYAQKQIAENMPAEPDKHDLLGFPNIEAEHPKWYIRKLWLVAENDRVEYPKSLDSNVLGLEKEAKKVIKKYVKNEHERYKELCGGAFLKKEAVHILKKLRFGQRIWGEDSGVETRLKSNLPGERPRWGVHTDSGYKSNDEDSIELWLRYWIAARIQNKINAFFVTSRAVDIYVVDSYHTNGTVTEAQ